MEASSQREIERALDLAKEFNLRPIIAGGEEADLVAARLKAENVPVLLSLNFPRRPQASPDADPEPLRTLRARVEAPKLAAKLATGGREVRVRGRRPHARGPTTSATWRARWRTASPPTRRCAR